ncbi:hypothetical protein GOV12_03035 [Candidatus Pacearchaeota archaeon]|nr:hypothetical protein [Candidatus Pacearchaeota archaeon]
MTTLEKVTQMKEQGISEPQIISLLKQEGVTPKEINDALTQAKIKSTVGDNRDATKGEEYNNMRPSIIEDSNHPQQPEPQPQNPQGQDPAYNEPQAYENYPSGQEYQNNQEYYPEYQGPSEGSSNDIALINDIAEQIVEEKSVELKKQVSESKIFENETKLELDKINNRLMKIENTLYELQIAIIKKVGEYGENIKNIKEEMSATQDSFSKILNPLTDNIRELQGISNKEKNTDSKKQVKEEIDESEKSKKRKSRSKEKDKDEIEKFIR